MRSIRFPSDHGKLYKRRRQIAVCAALWGGILISSTAAWPAVHDPLAVAEAIQVRLASGIPTLYCQAELPRFYALRQYMPAWITDEGLARHIPDLLTAIEASAGEGLHPADYHEGAIQERWKAFTLESESLPTLETAVDLELLATDAHLTLGSHFRSGCVRLKQPLRLAAYVLRDESGWERTRIDAVLATGKETTVTLSRPLPVHLLYWTVFVDKIGNLCFRDDVYGRDRRLVEALNRRPS